MKMNKNRKKLFKCPVSLPHDAVLVSALLFLPLSST